MCTNRITQILTIQTKATAIADADLGDDDPSEMYRVDLLTGEREEGFDRTMAEAYVRRALEFRRMTQTGFLGQCVGEISRGMFAFPNKSPEEVAGQTFALHKRHGDSIHSVLTNAVRSHASELVSGTLPRNWLLRMAISEHGRDFNDTPIERPSLSVQPDAFASDVRNYEQTSEIILATFTRMALPGQSLFSRKRDLSPGHSPLWKTHGVQRYFFKAIDPRKQAF